jgi:Mn2+/Fe2+ NRAMP family transporter
MTEILGVKGGTSSRAFRLIALSVIIIGCLLAITGIKPLTIILSAQFANGLLLPVIAGFLLYVMNKTQILGEYANGKRANILGLGVVLITAALGLRLILKSFGVL